MSDKFDLDRFGMCEKCAKYADHLIVMDTDDWTGRMCESCNDIYNDNNDYSRGLRKGYEQGQKDFAAEIESLVKQLMTECSNGDSIESLETAKELLERILPAPQGGE